VTVAPGSRWRMLGGVILASGALWAGCASGQGDGLATSLKGIPLGGGKVQDADGSAPALRRAPGRCPEDAPWNGRVCLGHGYVACPGISRFDDAGACVSEVVVDAGGEH
jgi:hypothetical protein